MTGQVGPQEEILIPLTVTWTAEVLYVIKYISRNIFYIEKERYFLALFCLCNNQVTYASYTYVYTFFLLKINIHFRVLIVMSF